MAYSKSPDTQINPSNGKGSIDKPIFSNAFSGMKMHEFLLRVQLT